MDISSKNYQWDISNVEKAIHAFALELETDESVDSNDSSIQVKSSLSVSQDSESESSNSSEISSEVESSDDRAKSSET